jgi:hypothetical protein
MEHVTHEGMQYSGVFDWHAFLEFVRSAPIDTSRENRSQLTTPAVVKFTSMPNTQDSPDFPTTLRMAEDGFTKGADSARKLANPLFDKVSSLIERSMPVYDVEGITFDVARVLENEPESWMRFENTIIEGKGNRVIRILFNMSASGGVNTSVIAAKGAVVSALIELLEYSGVRCEVWAADYSVSGGYSIPLRILVKQADQNLDMGRIMYAIAHPSALRRLFFRFIETCPADMWSWFSVGYGMVKEFSGAELDGIDLYVSGSSSSDVQWQDTASAEKWIIASLKAQGVHLNTEGEGGVA